LCVSVIKTPIRKHLHVKSWPFYNNAANKPLETGVSVTIQPD